MTSFNKSPFLFALIVFALVLLACRFTPTVKPPVLPTAPPQVLPTAHRLPTDTPRAPKPTNTETVEQPTDTPETPTEETSGETMTVTIFLVGLEDGGTTGQLIGCGDSLVPVEVEVPASEDVQLAAMEKLLSIHDMYYGESGLYNALYQSDLTVDSWKIQNDFVTFKLIGNFMMGGECDSPRIQMQLEATALQYGMTQGDIILINGKPLEDLLSGQ
jgi:hypothetical protein